jgi:acetyl esterase/lipase
MVALTIDASIPLTHLSGIQYGNADGRALLLDAVSPREAFTGAQPAVVWVHGGWYEGTRDDDWFSPYLATHGFFAVSIDYRLSGEVPFPAQIHNVKAAIRWLRANAERFSIDPQRIGIWGDSAGAHLAALAGVTGRPTGIGRGRRLARLLQPCPGRRAV